MRPALVWACAAALFAVVFTVPRVAYAQVCDFVGSPADGRILGPYFLSNTSDDITLTWQVEPGRSYVVEAMTEQGPSGGGALSPSININSSFCPTTDISSGVTITDSTSESPAIVTGGVRRSIVATSFSGFLEMRLHNNNGSGSNVLFSVTETTMFSPSWSTFTPFLTQWGFQNTTNSVVNATLTLNDSISGGPYTRSFSIQPGKALFMTTNSTFTGGPIPLNHNGGAILTHDGPPGAVLANSYVLKSDGSVALPVEFKPTRENRH